MCSEIKYMQPDGNAFDGVIWIVKSALAVSILLAATSGLSYASFRAGQANPPRTLNWNALLKAIAAVETGNNPQAVNEREQAYGVYQMRNLALIDANHSAGTNFSLYDLQDTRVATSMLRAYCHRYLEAPYTVDKVVDLWNGGPTGKANADYKQYVKNLYEEYK